MTTQLRQSIVLGKVQGGDVTITTEWLRLLNARFKEVSGSTTTTVTTDGSDHPAVVQLQQDLAALTARVVTLEQGAVSVERRLRALEGGYQV